MSRCRSAVGTLPLHRNEFRATCFSPIVANVSILLFMMNYYHHRDSADLISQEEQRSGYLVYFNFPPEVFSGLLRKVREYTPFSISSQ